MSEKPSENIPVTTMSNVPKKKYRGRGSSNKRVDNFVVNKNDAVCRERRSALERELQPNLLSAFHAYNQQAQTGVSTKKVLPVTTRGIGFHTLQFFKEAELNVPRIELPLRATVHQLYRVSLVQLARHTLLAEAGPTHSQAVRVSPKQRVAAFGFHRNSIFVADAISSVGNFTYNAIEHIAIIPDSNISMDTNEEVFESPVEYRATSPVAGISDTVVTPHQKKIIRRTHSIPDPYFITIYNLRDAVQALSSPDVPLVLRNNFICRNPIPGAVFVDGLLINPDEIMPDTFTKYMRDYFLREVDLCQALINQVAPICPGAIGSVAMDGKGNELSLCTVKTPPSTAFYINNQIVNNDDESWMFATQTLGEMTRLRSYVSLMNEAPLLPTRTELTSFYGVRDPNSACHSMNETWSRLAWNVSPFKIHHG